MEVAEKKIIDLASGSLEQSAAIIRSAFGKVAGELGITFENAPLFPAFITLERLEETRLRGALFYGLFIGGKQVGVVALEKRDTGDYYMERLAVLPEYWHGGLGRELVNFIIDRARRLGVRKLYLGMVNEHKVLKDWYKSMGFKEISVKKFENLPFSVCFMALDILIEER
ncbi:MAG: GNAT family N-acetyltransferase [Dehalococcoidales bacterium]